jgi:hypothetical protein
MRKLCGLLPLLGLYFGLSASAQAAEITRVASSFDKDNKFDLHFGVGYDFNFKKAALLREWSDANNPESQVVRDLLYQQMRHVVTPSLEIGLYKDLAVYVHVPIVALDTRTYSFDQGAGDCKYDDGMRTPDSPATCTDQQSADRANNSTTVRDNIVPQGGFDATNPDKPYDNFGGTDNQTLFKGANRRGVDQIHVGLKYAVLNQDRLSHMPKWVIAFEGRFAVGKPMTFSRDIHERGPEGQPYGRSRHARARHLDGAVAPLPLPRPVLQRLVVSRRSRSGNTLFKNLGGAQDRVNPQSQVGVTFGTEIVPFERKAKGQKVSVVLKGLAMLKFNGRGYSEGWELFADSPALVGSNKPGTATCTPGDIREINDAAKQDPQNPNYIPAGSGCSKFNGITNIQDFATFGSTWA